MLARDGIPLSTRKSSYRLSVDRSNCFIIQDAEDTDYGRGWLEQYGRSARSAYIDDKPSLFVRRQRCLVL